MHEMSIALSLLDQVLDHAARAGASIVETVTVEVGVQRQVVPEAMTLAWEAAREGTIASEARLDLVEVPVLARCPTCEQDFPPAIDDYRCPVCGIAAARIIRGNDITLVSMTCK